MRGAPLRALFFLPKIVKDYLELILLIPISVLPKWMGMAGNVYVIGALTTGFLFFYSCVQVLLDTTRARARRMLLTSVVYLPVFHLLMVLDPVRF